MTATLPRLRPSCLDKEHRARTIQDGPERLTHTRRRMKKCFYKTFQKYSQNLMNRLNFEIASSCFDGESETCFHWSVWTSHHFNVQLVPSCLNDCLQTLQIGVVRSWNFLLRNRPDSKVQEINIRAWECPHLLVLKHSWFGPAPPHRQPKAQGPMCEVKHRPIWKFHWYQKFLWGKEELFFCNMLE